MTSFCGNLYIIHSAAFFVLLVEAQEEVLVY